MSNKIITDQISSSILVKQSILSDPGLIEVIDKAAKLITNAYKAGFKTMLAGNGGSAADAQHIAAELVVRFYFDRPGLSSIALSTDTSILTAIGNDYGFDKLFARQVQAHGVPGDVFIGLSTSGNSPNVLNVLEQCKKMGIATIGLTGMGGGEMKQHCDICIEVPSVDTPRIQEAHILIGHIICCIVEQEIFGSPQHDTLL
ncbi:SIS domain-containing protein [Mucilaginibacter calamicampi]|uniref:Phosphoheptose isomerase n=1 Tax=Mucilaginibacter calamicampi TaxID=1302352 RepID=A0ABW2YX45_9SPHI